MGCPEKQGRILLDMLPSKPDVNMQYRFCVGIRFQKDYKHLHEIQDGDLNGYDFSLPKKIHDEIFRGMYVLEDPSHPYLRPHFKAFLTVAFYRYRSWRFREFY